VDLRRTRRTLVLPRRADGNDPAVGHDVECPRTRRSGRRESPGHGMC